MKFQFPKANKQNKGCAAVKSERTEERVAEILAISDERVAEQTCER